MWKWMLLLITLPGLGGVDRKELFEMLDNGRNMQAAEKVRAECIDFTVNKTDLDRLVEYQEVLLAIIQCLQGSAPEAGQKLQVSSERQPPVRQKPMPQTRPEPEKETSTVVSANPEQSAPSATVEVTEAAPKKVQPKPETPRPSAPKPMASAEPAAGPIADALRAASVADGLRDEGARMEAMLGARKRLIDVLQFGGELPETEIAGAPSWFPPIYKNALAARRSGNARVSFSAAGNVIFRGIDGRDGARVHMGLYLVDRHRKDNEAYELYDHFMVGHKRFPAEYDRSENQFAFKQLETRQVDVRLARYLKKQEAVELFPGDWMLELIAYDGSGRLQGRYKVAFSVEAGGNYELELSFQTARNGVKTLEHDLIKK